MDRDFDLDLEFGLDLDFDLDLNFRLEFDRERGLALMISARNFVLRRCAEMLCRDVCETWAGRETFCVDAAQLFGCDEQGQTKIPLALQDTFD